MLNSSTFSPSSKIDSPPYDENMFGKSLRWLQNAQRGGNTVTIMGPAPPLDGEEDALINMDLPGFGPVTVPWRAWITAAILLGAKFEVEHPRE